MSRVKFNANSHYQYFENFNILSNCFGKHHVNRPLYHRAARGAYDAVGRRKGAAADAPTTAPTSARTSTSADTGVRRPAGGAAASAPRTTSRQAGAGGRQASTLLQQNNAELMEIVQGLERE
ncbi:microtubule integrity protein mal3 [Elasticomyces elasticus]|nr:microtubule integrity protein mal3 [Elasticomyces elasticus]